MNQGVGVIENMFVDRVQASANNINYSIAINLPEIFINLNSRQQNRKSFFL